MSDDLLIGKSRLDRRGGFSGGKWFYLEDNKDNVFRVLPPLHSLARTGEYGKYHSVHRQIKGTDGKQRPFLCIQEKNFKTKAITRRCPLCDKVAELTAKLNAAKESGQISKEDAAAFEKNNIWALKSEKKYYLNVVNQDGNVGVLSVSITMFQDLENTLKEWDKKGFDLTGGKGAFLNFTVSKKFKGDRDAVHKVVPYTQVNKDGSFNLVQHELTPDVIEKVKQSSRDLSKIFKNLNDEDVAMLAATDGLERSQLADRLFGGQENTSDVSPETYSDQVEEAQEGLNGSRLEARIPGTQARAVTNVSVGETGINVNTPVDLLQTKGPANSLPKNDLPSTPQQAPVAASKPKTSASMSDDEFMSMFKPSK